MLQVFFYLSLYLCASMHSFTLKHSFNWAYNTFEVANKNKYKTILFILNIKFK